MDIDKIIEADGNIFRTSIPDANISMSYRLLSLREYKVFKSLRDGGVMPPFVVNEMVFERCFLGTPSLINKDIPAGITISIGDLIMYLSGDCDSETLVEDIVMARQLYPGGTVFEYMRSAIITAFPTTTVESLDGMTRTQFLKHFAIAENVLSKQNAEYEKLNVKDIKTAGEMAAQQNSHGINFAQENRAIKQSMGHWNNEEAEQRYRQESKPKKTLTKEQAEKLANRSR